MDQWTYRHVCYEPELLAHLFGKTYEMELEDTESEMLIAESIREIEIAKLNSFIDMLPKKQQEALFLYRQGYNYTQIGIILHVSKQAIQRRMARSLRCLKTLNLEQESQKLQESQEVQVQEKENQK